MRTGARTFIHPDDAAHAKSQGAEIDRELNVGAQIGPLVIVAVPGKSRRGCAALAGALAPDRGRRGDR
jgi:hypothetical protein